MANLEKNHKSEKKKLHFCSISSKKLQSCATKFWSVSKFNIKTEKILTKGIFFMLRRIAFALKQKKTFQLENPKMSDLIYNFQ
jgi:hypothetical protein